MVGPIFTSEGFVVSLLLVAVPILVVLLRQKSVRA
jgi:hypothetical protein